MNMFEKARIALEKDVEWKKACEEMDRQNAYLNDPSISEHDKELQWALDHDMRDPVEDEALMKKQLAYLETHPYPEQMEYHGFNSWDEVKEDLREQLSPDRRIARARAYERYRAMVAEAVSRGFVRGGNCKSMKRGGA